MKSKLLVLALVLVLVGGVAQPRASARVAPAIVLFDSSLDSITLAEAESGVATTTLTWYTAGLTEDYRILLHEYVLNDWQLVFAEDSVPLEPSGARVVTVRHPLNFGPPTYLLSIVRANSNAIVDQRVAEIQYDLGESVPSPEVESFTTDLESVDFAELAAGNVRALVSWNVTNRIPTSNLIFEQVLPDNSVVSVELPRQNLWVPSTSQGPIAPVLPEAGDTIVLRLRVMDVISKVVYDEALIELPLVNITRTEPTTATGIETAAQAIEPPPGNRIQSFSATPSTINPGAPVTLAWRTVGTNGVIVEQSVPNVIATQVVVNAASPEGTAVVYAPDYAAYSVIYTLYTPDRAESQQVTVAVHCPYTFFFGDADGCPSGPVRNVGMVYQAFEGGFMLWRGDTNEIYAFYDDGGMQVFLEQDYANLPEVVLDDVPPLNRAMPVAGFAKVWANAPGVRDRLGWGLDVEQGYTARTQAVAATRLPRPSFVFYVVLPGGEVVGAGYGTWRTIMG